MKRPRLNGGWLAGLAFSAAVGCAACARGEDSPLDPDVPETTDAGRVSDAAVSRGHDASSVPLPGADSGEPDPTQPDDAGVDVFVSMDAQTDVTQPAEAGSPDGSSGGTCPSPAVVVINELRVDGSTASDEFVELYNPRDCIANIAGFSIKYSSASGSSAVSRWTAVSGAKLQPHQLAVVASSSYSGPQTPVIGTLNSGFAKDGGGVGLYDQDGTRIDGVAYGSASGNSEGEGSPAAAPDTQSLSRVPDGKDTQHNNTDFTVTTPTPGTANH